MRNYRLISGDSHINEPPDLWQSRAPQKFKHRAPRMEHFPQGDAWVLEGGRDPISFGSNRSGGLPPEQNVTWCRWEDVRPGGYEPAARLEEQDQDGVDAEVMYPTPRISSSLFWNTADPEFHVWLIRAYNDWLSEYCAHAPERLVGVALLPNIGAEAAVEELQRAAKLPGMRGVLLGRYPSGENGISEADDPVWAAAVANDIPVSIHVSLTSGPPGDTGRSKFSSGEFRFREAPERVAEFIYSGALDRYPELALVLAEVDCAWVPYVKEQMDDRYRRMPASRRN